MQKWEPHPSWPSSAWRWCWRKFKNSKLDKQRNTLSRNFRYEITKYRRYSVQLPPNSWFCNRFCFGIATLIIISRPCCDDHDDPDNPLTNILSKKSILAINYGLYVLQTFIFHSKCQKIFKNSFCRKRFMCLDRNIHPDSSCFWSGAGMQCCHKHKTGLIVRFFKIFSSKPSLSHQFRLFFQNFIINLIDFSF